MSDPFEEINQVTLCLHCVHYKVCLVRNMTQELRDKIPSNTFGYFYGKFSEVAEQCKQYKRKWLAGMIPISRDNYKWLIHQVDLKIKLARKSMEILGEDKEGIEVQDLTEKKLKEIEELYEE